MKYDCSRILDYIHERDRICRTIGTCDSCPLYALFRCDVSDATQETVDAVQRWSDEHPEQPKLTKREYEFLSAFAPFIEGRAIKRTPMGLYLIFHYAFSNVTNDEYIDPHLFSFISVDEEWDFQKLLGLEVEE